VTAVACLRAGRWQQRFARCYRDGMALVLLLALVAAPSAGVPPSALPASASATQEHPLVYQLNRRSNGEYIYVGSNFEALVTRDGSVRFRERFGVWGVMLPLAPLPLPPGTRTLEGTVREAMGKAPRPAGGAALAPPGTVVLEICESTPCLDPNRVLGAVFATFDLNELCLRALGEDPDSFEKARFLVVTGDWRQRLAVSQRDRRKDAALANQENQLQTIWRNRRYNANERRRLLFNLWLEMDDSPEGRQGATNIVRFIRTRLPAGSPAAFTAAELATMNAAAAPQRFDPYGGP
jgi:hypothetical protein